MKKIISLTFTLCVLSATLFASGYKLDNQHVDALFANADDVTLNAVTTDNSASTLMNAMPSPPDQTVGGFLIRNFFCGGFAMHRGYMGNGGKSLWPYYLCIPIAGMVASYGDFFYVLIKGSEAMEKYRDNSKYFVWLD